MRKMENKELVNGREVNISTEFTEIANILKKNNEILGIMASTSKTHAEAIDALRKITEQLVKDVNQLMIAHKDDGK